MCVNYHPYFIELLILKFVKYFSYFSVIVLSVIMAKVKVEPV